MQSTPLAVLGIMSGTSLDGIDFCLAEFEYNNRQWSFEIAASETFAYTNEWRAKLQSAHLLQAFDFVALHKAYGKFLGEQAAVFLRQQQTVAQYIASHGHTIFHRPQQGITFQLGDGNALAAAANCSTIFDFRSLNVAQGGQGAPLVPVGDRLLFAEYEACLNLGGFVNISFDDERGERIAFDICPCNIVLNFLCRDLALDYDHNGQHAAQGTIDVQLLESLNALDFYTQKGAKSLGREWVEESVFALLDRCTGSTRDKLCTVCEHVAMQVAACVAGKKVLATGGGAHNAYLMQRLAHHCKQEICKPSRQIVDFKEALIFAFLGALYLHNQPNCLASATGAPQNCIGGNLVKF